MASVPLGLVAALQLGIRPRATQEIGATKKVVYIYFFVLRWLNTCFFPLKCGKSHIFLSDCLFTEALRCLASGDGFWVGHGNHLGSGGDAGP